MTKKSYCIVAPHFDHKSSGIKSLYYLCHKLNIAGYDAYITSDPRNSGYNIKSLNSLNSEQLKDLQLNGVVIYPDQIIRGNPLKFTNVIRWFLAYTEIVPDHELAFSYSPSHNIGAQAKNNLMMFDIEPFFKFPEIENRIYKCFRIGKNHGAPLQAITNGCIEISYGYPNTRIELANLLKSSSVFYSYDFLSSLTVEALYCGCPVVIVGCPLEKRKEVANNIMWQYGLGFYDENFTQKDLDKLKEEIPLQIEKYKEITLNWSKEFDNFINLTQNMSNVYVEDSGGYDFNNPHPWIKLGFWPDFFSLFRER